MATIIGERQEVGVRKVEKVTTVPANPKAKLMYYLDCVATLIELDNPNLNRLRNFQNYYSLNDAETDALLTLVVLLSSDELIGKIIFPREDLPGGNEFYELSAVSHMFAVSDNMVIGGKKTRVAKIMCFKRLWLENNYITPILSFKSRLERIARGLPGRAPSPPRALPPPRAFPPAPTVRPRSPPESCMCNIL